MAPSFSATPFAKQTGTCQLSSETVLFLLLRPCVWFEAALKLLSY